MSKPLTAEQAIFLLQEVSLPVLKAEHRMTKAVLEAVPADKPDFQPDPFAKTAIELVRHIAAAENRFLETTINGVFSTGPTAIPENVKTPTEVATWYASQFEKNCEALAKLSGGTTAEDGGFPRDVPAARSGFLTDRLEPLDPSSRAVVHVLAADGRQGARHLRRKLRQRAGKESCRAIAATGRPFSSTGFGIDGGPL